MKKIKLQNRPFGPFPTILVGANVNGKPNYVTVGACGVVSLKPVLYVSLKDSHYTTLGIKENGYFSVNIPSADLVQKTDYCGIVSGHKTDKSNLFTSFYDELGKAPMVEECTMNFLCKVIQTIPVFDFQMFLGEIEAVYINEECMTDDKPDPLKINPLIMMDSNYYDLGKDVGTLFKTGLEILPK
ncbi:flavin reductase family protein [Clostridium botulinum]|uniref:Flavin reductase family protein n=2 Tax=Clostridium botulinum TaxID=1491 RepID=A0A6B3WCH8_CLOBO|nr:flavin reductase family protein [Clostridium botulinum]ACO86697.1 putative flavoredoxin [Clostridium botulinum A2 str. Kyoto]APH24997.1 flavoredoxin [Clostridium botulinum]APQ69979.1 flavoredoxin [Clostridium botulinum]AUN06030.1 flavin reductase [Clostridium botulinum]EPS53650.1 putative flavoredoxin [Clostridium botulinum Af84]